MNKKHLYAAVILLLLLAIGIKPALAIKHIPSDTTIGTWDPGGRKYTLTTNVTETIQIDENSLTLDGAGYKVTGSGSGYGISLRFRRYVTVKNLTVEEFEEGISLYNYHVSDEEKWKGYNTIENNTISSNLTGINIGASNENTVNNNIVSTCDYGIHIAGSDNNTITENTVGSSITAGIWLTRAMQGYLLVGSHNNTLTGNTTQNSQGFGIYINLSNNNTIYNNNFIDNGLQAYVTGGSGNVFDLGDPAEEDGKGGNYWSNWTTPDVDGDGIVDNPYVMPPYLVDNYPWTIENGWLTPPTPQALIVQLIDTVAEMNLQQGIDNSLDAKLDAAFNALDDVNQNNDVAAINSLNAFKNAVEAQRDNKLTGAQADELIAKANGIIAMLSG